MKIICLGKNYPAHSQEMNEAQPEKPVIFFKPSFTRLDLKNNQDLILAWDRGEIHYECEVVMEIKNKKVYQLGLGLDLTLRNLQKELKNLGHPWEKAKSFEFSSLVGPMIPAHQFNLWGQTEFEFWINGEIRQKAKLSQALVSGDALLNYIQEYFPLEDGDLIFTGTPQGVGPLHPGMKCELKWGHLHTKFQLLGQV